MMTEIGVIIPFYQRDRGILRRALQSVFDQILPATVIVRIIVVDDGSPSPPEHDLSGIDVPPNFSVEVMPRPNGGPAAARNTGVTIAIERCDFAAFLDSDDIWLPHHLAVALKSLESGGQFYFSNSQLDDSRTWFEIYEFFRTGKELSICEVIDDDELIFRFPGTTLLSPVLRECLPHTSTVVVKASLLPELHFDEDLRYSGEDYLCWVRLAARYPNSVFSKKVMVLRGRGVDLFRNSVDWSNPRTLYQLASAMVSVQRMLPFAKTPQDRAFVCKRLEAARRNVSYLIVRNILRDPRGVSRTAGFLNRAAPGFWLGVPYRALSRALDR